MLSVSGLSVEPLAGGIVPPEGLYDFWIVADGVGEVMTQIHFKL